MTVTTDLRRLRADVGELLERHDRGGSLEEFAAYRDDPVAFMREVLRWEPYEKQEEIAEAVRDHALVAVRGANGTGKDACAARLALWWAVSRGGLVVLSGTTSTQVEETLMRKEVGLAFRTARQLPGELHVRAYRPQGDGAAGIVAKTATGVSALTGFHDASVLFIVTESQGCEDHVLEAAFACTTGDQDRILLLGNPTTPSGFFYRCSRDPAWHAIKIPAHETPNVLAGRVVVPGLITREGVDRIIAQWGEGSPFVEARIRAEFPEQEVEGLIRRSWIEQAVERWRVWRARTPTPESVPRRNWPDSYPAARAADVIVAIDPARYGPDSTCCAIRRGDVLESFESWRSCDLMESVDRARGLLERLGVSTESGVHLVVDVVGLGGGLADRLRELGYGVQQFNGGVSAAGLWRGERYLNLRAAAYWGLREKLEAGQISLPPDERLAEELLALRWRPTAAGQVQLESKDDIRGRLGRSPDRADALSMAFSPSVREPGDLGISVGNL